MNSANNPGSDTAPPSVWTVVVAAGASTRYGRPKLLERLAGRTVIEHSLSRALAMSSGVVVVADDGDIARRCAAAHVIVGGGRTRSESVRRGLAEVPMSADIVLVHDAARPGADSDLYSRVIDAVEAGADAAVPGVPVVDTIKEVDDDRVVVATPDRAHLMAVQTPQGFRAASLRDAHRNEGDATDDAALIEDAGGVVVIVDGAEDNLKITTPRDLTVITATWGHATSAERSPVRVGHGYDIHKISDDPERQLVLGGVRFDGHPGLVGHSDADVVTHAAIDAVLAACGLGDIGQLFPDTDPSLAGADSIELFAEAMRHVDEAGFDVVNVDCTVVADRPKLAPRRPEMQELLSGVAGGPVSVKGRTTEGVGSLGRGDAIVCMAVALVAER